MSTDLKKDAAVAVFKEDVRLAVESNEDGASLRIRIQEALVALPETGLADNIKMLAADIKGATADTVKSLVAQFLKKKTPKVVYPIRKENVLRGSGVGPIVSLEVGRKLLDRMAVDDDSTDWAMSELVGAVEMVRRLEISAGTLDNWRNAKKVIALPKGLRNFVYPVRQFTKRGPIPGLDLVAEHFASPEQTWDWLVVPNKMTDGKAPIDQLRDGFVEMVTRAAEGALDYA